MKQIFSIGIVLVVLLLALVACSSPDAPAAEPAAVSEANEPEVELVETEPETEGVDEVSEEASEEMEEAAASEEMAEENGPSAQEIAQMERAAAGTIRDNERAGNRQVAEAAAEEDEVRSLASFLPDLGEAPEIINGEPWINSDPLTLEDLEGKVVLIEFWTYS